MAFSSENLLKQLDRPEIIDWALELKNRKEAYTFLTQAVRGNKLNLNQFRNALHALFRIAFPENGPGVLQTFVDVAGDPNEAIRSEAVQVAIGLLRWSANNQKTPVLLSVDQEDSLRRAMAQGLSPKVAKLAARYFGL